MPKYPLIIESPLLKGEPFRLLYSNPRLIPVFFIFKPNAGRTKKPTSL